MEVDKDFIVEVDLEEYSKCEASEALLGGQISDGKGEQSFHCSLVFENSQAGILVQHLVHSPVQVDSGLQGK